MGFAKLEQIRIFQKQTFVGVEFPIQKILILQILI